MMDDMTISENIREHLGKVKAVLQSNTITYVMIALYVLLQTVHTAIPYKYLKEWGVDKAIHIVPTALFCFIILSLLIEIYKTLKDTGQRIDDYMIYVFLNVGKTMLILIILFIFCSTVDSLMAKKLFYRYYIDVMFEEQTAGRVLVLDTFYLGPVGVFVIGLYLGFKMILTLQGMGEKLGEFSHNLIRDVLHTMILCAIGYAYFHMLVILLAEDVYVSAAISVLSAIWLSVVILAGDNTDKIKYGKIISIITGLMIPLVFLQGCDMTVRIYRYGMRPERYVGMVLFLFEISAMLIHYFGKGKYGRLLPLFGMLVVITLYVPGINMNSVSNRWQMSLLKKYYQAVCDKEVISRSAYERLKDSYDYLGWWAWAKMDDKMDEAIEDYDIYEKSFVVKLKQQYPEADLTQSDYHIIDCSHMAEEVEDSGYSYTSWLKQNSCYVKEEDGGIAVDFSAFQFIEDKTGRIITADISEFIENVIEYEKEYPYVSGEQCSEAMKKYSCIELDDDMVLYIHKCHVMYNDGVKNAEPCFEWCSIDINAKLCQY